MMWISRETQLESRKPASLWPCSLPSRHSTGLLCSPPAFYDKMLPSTHGSRKTCITSHLDTITQIPPLDVSALILLLICPIFDAFQSCRHQNTSPGHFSLPAPQLNAFITSSFSFEVKCLLCTDPGVLTTVHTHATQASIKT